MLAAIRRASAYQQFGCGAPSRLVLEIDISELLTIVLAHRKTDGLFFD
jgi:hypothetical protein